MDALPPPARYGDARNAGGLAPGGTEVPAPLAQ